MLANFAKHDRAKISSTALNLARSVKAYVTSMKEDGEIRRNRIARYEIEIHRKLTLSFACLVLFFIGAPLGAIIRKGGLGMPVVVSVLFFLLYYVISISGEKFVKEGVWSVEKGMWLSSIILLPIGMFLTYKATSDSSLFEIDAYVGPVRRFFQRLFKRQETHAQ